LSDSRRRQLIENEFPNTRDIVILAVPYPALADIAGKYGDQLAGKVVVDITPDHRPPRGRRH
jgi:predicted dinucleotide-binding enzyme